MTYAMIAAQMFDDLISGRENPWTDLYDPRRPLLSKKTLSKAQDYLGEFLGGALKNIIR